MRLWIVHPKYLDCKGLVALWRESLLARKVLKGRTMGWRHHPQLNKFRTHNNPPVAVNTYLLYILNESRNRCYKFDKRKIEKKFTRTRIKVKRKDVMEEFEVLKGKLKVRDPERYIRLLKIRKPELNSIFLYS